MRCLQIFISHQCYRSEDVSNTNSRAGIRFYKHILKVMEGRNNEIERQNKDKSKTTIATAGMNTRHKNKRKPSIEPPTKSSKSKSSKYSKKVKPETSESENDDDESHESNDESSLTSGSDISIISVGADFLDQHNELCEVCAKGGELLCCSTCTLVFHFACVRPTIRAPPNNNWSCAYCVATGVTGLKKEARARRRAAQAIREMTKMTEELKKKKDKVDEDDEEVKENTDKEETNESSAPSSPCRSQSLCSDEASSTKSKKSCSTSNSISLKSKARHKLIDSLTPKEIDIKKTRATRRKRRQPTLFDPQSCPASEWKSDTANKWREPAKIETNNQKSKSVSSPRKEKKQHNVKNSCALIKYTGNTANKNVKGNQDTNKEEKREPKLWCTYCKDDKHITVCCFCGCRECFSKHDEKNLLICDACDSEYHIYCLDPPLTSIPKTKTWFCPSCKPKYPTPKSDRADAVNKVDVSSTMKSRIQSTSKKIQPKPENSIKKDTINQDGTKRKKIVKESPDQDDPHAPKKQKLNSKIVFKDEAMAKINNIALTSPIAGEIEDDKENASQVEVEPNVKFTSERKNIESNVSKVASKPSAINVPSIQSQMSLTNFKNTQALVSKDDQKSLNITHVEHDKKKGKKSDTNKNKEINRSPIKKSNTFSDGNLFRGSKSDLKYEDSTGVRNVSDSLLSENLDYAKPVPATGDKDGEKSITKVYPTKRDLKNDTKEAKSSLESKLIRNKKACTSPLFPEGDDTDTRFTPKIESTNNMHSSSSIHISQKSRSGRSIKRNAFHDEVELEKQHFKPQLNCVDQKQKIPKNIFQQKIELCDGKSNPQRKEKGETTKLPLVTIQNEKKSIELKRVEESSVQSKKIVLAVATTTLTTDTIPETLLPKTSAVAKITINNSENENNERNNTNEEKATISSKAINDQTTTITETIPSNINSAISSIKVPRRKPGARECMQISRRFGVQIIPQKYMDTLLVRQHVGTFHLQLLGTLLKANSHCIIS